MHKHKLHRFWHAMASAFPSSFFSISGGNARSLKKAGVGAGVAVLVGIVGAHYYHRQSSHGALSVSLSDLIPSFTRKSRPWNDSLLPFACLAAPSFVEPNTGVFFPSSISTSDDSAKPHQLAGVGLRKKNILGLKSITVYAYGVYADEASLKDKLATKYLNQSITALKASKSFKDDIIASDFDLTVRLVIVYGRLKIASVRSAFQESIGSRIQKYSGKEDRPLLESFTSLFKDDIKLPKGTTIDVRRGPDHVLTTSIDGKELGSVKSPLLCRAFLDLYVGEEPFDLKGKEDIEANLAAVVGS